MAEDLFPSIFADWPPAASFPWPSASTGQDHQEEEMEQVDWSVLELDDLFDFAGASGNAGVEDEEQRTAYSTEASMIYPPGFPLFDFGCELATTSPGRDILGQTQTQTRTTHPTPSHFSFSNSTGRDSIDTEMPEPPELLRTSSSPGSADEVFLEPAELELALLYSPLPFLALPSSSGNQDVTIAEEEEDDDATISLAAECSVTGDSALAHQHTHHDGQEERPQQQQRALKWQTPLLPQPPQQQQQQQLYPHRPLLPKPGESANGTGAGFKFVGRQVKRRRFSEDGKAKVRSVRRVGACVRCRMLKKSCTPVPTGGCCEECRKNTHPRVWNQPCVRIKLTELVIYESAEWKAILDSITETMTPRSWARGQYQLEIKGDENEAGGPTLRFQLSRMLDPLDRTSRDDSGSEIPLKSFALKKGHRAISGSDFDAFVDGLTRKCTDRIFVYFLSSLLKETVAYADRTDDPLVRLALRYYIYCRLTHACLRGICYEGYNGGVGVGVWLRRMFHWDTLSPELRAQILLFVSARTQAIEKTLFAQIERHLGRKKEGAFIPALLGLSVLVDQMDCNVHEGRWLGKPSENMVCPRKTPLLSGLPVPTETLGTRLTAKADGLGELVVRFSRIVNERVLALEGLRAKNQAISEDAKFYLELRDRLRGPRCHLGGSAAAPATYLEQLIFLDEPAVPVSDDEGPHAATTAAAVDQLTPHLTSTCTCTEILLRTHLLPPSPSSSSVPVDDLGIQPHALTQNWQRPLSLPPHRCNCPRLDFYHDRSYQPCGAECCERVVVWDGEVACMSLVEGEAHSRFSVPRVRERRAGLVVGGV